MTLRIYDDTTHQAVPKEPNKDMMDAGSALPAINLVADLPRTKAGWTPNALQNRYRYIAMLVAAPPHGAAMPTREEIAFTLCRTNEWECFCEKKNCKGDTVCLRFTQKADAILALIQDRMKP